MLMQITSRLTICVVLLLATGCSKSLTTQASFGSSSDSSSSPFKSSSKSSSGAEEKEQKPEDQEAPKETAYQRDIRNYTTAFAQSADAADTERFQRELASIAERYGITDWEQVDETYLAVGRGLADSELDDQRVEELAVALSNRDGNHLVSIQSGYANRRRQ